MPGSAKAASAVSDAGTRIALTTCWNSDRLSVGLVPWGASDAIS